MELKTTAGNKRPNARLCVSGVSALLKAKGRVMPGTRWKENE